MRHKKIPAIIGCLIMAVTLPMLFGSCGSMRSYWGVEGDYDFPYGGEGGYYYQHESKHKKHKKHKKRKHHHGDDDNVRWDDGISNYPT